MSASAFKNEPQLGPPSFVSIAGHCFREFKLVLLPSQTVDYCEHRPSFAPVWQVLFGYCRSNVRAIQSPGQPVPAYENRWQWYWQQSESSVEQQFTSGPNVTVQPGGLGQVNTFASHRLLANAAVCQITRPTNVKLTTFAKRCSVLTFIVFSYILFETTTMSRMLIGAGLDLSGPAD